MKIVISGASGMVGAGLTDALKAEQHDVWYLVRPGHPLKPNEIRWDPLSAQVDVAALEGFDAVVHLSGASVAAERWTKQRKEVLRSSRIDSTRVLVDSLAQLKQPPKVFIVASAVGYYGSRGDEVLVESSSPGRDFLALLARDWEAEANRVAQAGIRTVILRFGVIFARKGGGLEQMVRPFRFGAGGRIGDGRQWLAWVALDDVIRVIEMAIGDPRMNGAYNTVAPEPVRNADFAKAVGHVLHRPAIVPAPKFALRVALGEMADALLLASQRAIPEKLQEIGYEFQFADLETTLKAML